MERLAERKIAHDYALQATMAQVASVGRQGHAPVATRPLPFGNVGVRFTRGDLQSRRLVASRGKHAHVDCLAITKRRKLLVPVPAAQVHAIAVVDLAQPAVPVLTIQGAAPDDRTGIWIAAGFDWNADGLDDVAVGAWLADPPARSDAGCVYVVFGNAQPPATSSMVNVVTASKGAWRVAAAAAERGR